jgi:transcriptional regulator with XRE-family HTH domain
MLKAERLRASMTQTQLAAAARVSTETIRKYEAGARTPSRERLILVLDAMEVPLSRAGSVLLAAGYAPRRSPSLGAGSAEIPTGSASFAPAVHKVPWPRLVADETLCVLSANPPFTRLLGLEPSFALHRTRAQLNFVSMLAAPTVAAHLGNLDECLGWAMAGLKSRLAHAHAPDASLALADEVLAQCIAQDSAGARRIMGLWESTPAASHYGASTCPIVWTVLDGPPALLVAVETRPNGVHGPAIIEWHAADAASHVRLEAILDAAPCTLTAKSADRLRQSLRP